MKAVLLVLFVGLLMVGWGESSKPSEPLDRISRVPSKDAIESAVDWYRLQDRNGVTYVPNTDKPYSGYAKRAYENEQIEVFAQFEDGYVVRLKQWQKNGTPRWDFGYVQGKVGLSNVPHDSWHDDDSSHKDGPSTRWLKNGQKEEEGNFKDGKRDGLWTYWHENGQKMAEVNFKDGKQDGLSTSWYENGQKKEENNHKDGKQVGTWTEWYESGQKEEEGNYKDGKPDGLWTRYYKNGQKKAEGNYKDGVIGLIIEGEDGLWTRWYENGQKEEESNFKDGKLMSAVRWKPNGEKCPDTNVKDGNGILVVYNYDGTEAARDTYKDGKEVD